VFEKIGEIHQLGTSILIIEQDAYRAINISDRTYVLVMGRNVFEGPSAEILNNEELHKAYLGG